LLVAGGAQPTASPPESGDKVGRSGPTGVPTVIAAEAVLDDPVPIALTAATVNVALVELLSPVIASVVADRAVGLLGLFWLAAASAIFLNFAPLPPSVITPTILVGALALGGYLTAPLLARLIHLMPRPIRRAGGIIAPYLHRPGALLVPIALSVALQTILAVGQYSLAVGLGLNAPLSLFLLCVPIANVVASLPLTLNGLGIRESAYLVLFGMAGMRKEDAIALGLLWFAATVISGLTGGIAFVTTPVPSATPKAVGIAPSTPPA